jgi:hypothetical protein
MSNCRSHEKEEKMSRKICSTVRWGARAGAVLITAGLAAFVVGQPAGPLSAIDSRDWVGMVLLFGAVAAMLLAWKWEFPAALISLFALSAFAAVVHVHRFGALLIAMVPNFLFLIDWKLRRLQSTSLPKLG